LQAPSQDVDIGRDEKLLIDAVREAGALALEHFRSSPVGRKKDDGTPVSDADLAVNDLLHDRLAMARPDYGWLSEETEDRPERLSRRRVWVVDPIDGTRSFLKGADNWSVAVALIEAGRPVLGSVFAPATGEYFHARLNHGANCNGAPIAASHRDMLAGSSFIAHPNILRADRWQQGWPELETGMTTSIALRLCMVANGQFDAALAVGEKCDWDLAAGDLIVHEAGGRVSTLAGSQMTYNQPHTRQTGLVASGSALHDEITARTQGFKGMLA
jgi:myo-inositol-1(or 4)-monophosphatase